MQYKETMIFLRDTEGTGYMWTLSALLAMVEDGSCRCLIVPGDESDNTKEVTEIMRIEKKEV